MAKTICLVVANEILENKKVSPKFFSTAKVPVVFFRYTDFFGLITLKEKDPDFLDVFQIGRPQQEVITAPVYRWNINVFETAAKKESALFLAGGYDQDPDEISLTDILKNKIPDCVLLTNIEALEPIQKVCEAENIKLIVHRFDGILASS